MNNDELLIAFSNGDEIAFNMIYQKYHTIIFLIIKDYVHSEDDAKDIRSGCFIKLWELHDKLHFNSLAALFVWLRTTAKNRCVDYLRALKIYDNKKKIIENEYSYYSEKEIFEVADKEAAILNRILKRLDRMPNMFKEVFMMRCLDEMKFTEIAKVLNADISTVKKRYSRALYLLKNSIQINNQ